ncbi:MAG: sigma-54 dependent transcriptional regulator [Chlamydiota bacterium]
MMTKSVLIIDKNLAARELLLELLRQKGFRLFTVSEGAGALELLQRENFACIFSDLAGIRSLKRMKRQPEAIPLIALEGGEQKKQQRSVAAALKHPVQKADLEAVLRQWVFREDAVPMIAESRPMKQILKRVEKIAQSHSNVFIIGESGTGKEVVASKIHALSKRAAFPFIKVNCAALPDTLIESEFFGHEKGAFTGAHLKRIGRFERADRGTLLLDEISEIPAALQAKLLRVVQEQELERLGGTEAFKVDVRLISTSNQNMQEALQQKRFREDLYYRLNVIPIFLPPLRERREDILPLANWFLQQICARNQLVDTTFSRAAREKLCQYSWPGNVRELRNVIEHSLVMSNAACIEEVLFDPSAQLKKPSDQQQMTLKALEKKHVLATFKRNNCHQGKTATALGISVRTLRNKLKLYTEANSK